MRYPDAPCRVKSAAVALVDVKLGLMSADNIKDIVREWGLAFARGRQCASASSILRLRAKGTREGWAIVAG